MPETEAIDRLFLELSQFAQAKTAREIAMENALRRIAEMRHSESKPETLLAAAVSLAEVGLLNARVTETA